MPVDLSDEQYVDSVKREVIPLGTTAFANVTDDQWVGYLSDAFWEARLDGLLMGFSCDEDGLVTSNSGDMDLPRQYVALVVLYAGIRVLRNQILSTNASTKLRAKAGPVEYETESANSATTLTEMLKQLAATKARVLAELDAGAYGSTSVSVLDAYSVRLFSPASYYGSPELT